MARAAPRSRRDWRAAPPSRCACRPAATRPARTASFRRRAERAAAGRCTRCCRRSSASAAPAIGRSRSPACISGRTAAIWPTARRCWSLLERRSSGTRQACASASARSSRWTARTRSSISWPRRRASRRIFIFRCSTRAIRCSWRCGGRTRWRITAGSSIAFGATMPHASIGTDIIVGFPGETDRDFAVLEAYLRESPITHVHVFPYSDRPGTAATALAGQGSRLGRARARERCSRDRPRAEPAVPSRAERHRPAGADDRRRLARRDG